jgi:hypothetical protein
MFRQPFIVLCRKSGDFRLDEGIALTLCGVCADVLFIEQARNVVAFGGEDSA